MKNYKNLATVVGVHPIRELLKAKKRKIRTLYTVKPEPKSLSAIKKYWPKYPINIQYVKKDALDKLAGTSDHQNLVAVADPLEIMKKFFDPEKHPRLILLDGIHDPRNLGAIIRSAYCTGFDGVILCEKNASPLNATAIKASAGLAEHTLFYLAPTIKHAITQVKNAGYHPYLTTLTKGTDALSIDYKTPLCLVIGNEEKGISQEIINQGTRITLPQKSADISYNASVAAGIFMFLIKNR